MLAIWERNTDLRFEAVVTWTNGSHEVPEGCCGAGLWGLTPYNATISCKLRTLATPRSASCRRSQDYQHLQAGALQRDPVGNFKTRADALGLRRNPPGMVKALASRGPRHHEATHLPRKRRHIQPWGRRRSVYLRQAASRFQSWCPIVAPFTKVHAWQKFPMKLTALWCQPNGVPRAAENTARQ